MLLDRKTHSFQDVDSPQIFFTNSNPNGLFVWNSKGDSKIQMEGQKANDQDTSKKEDGIWLG